MSKANLRINHPRFPLRIIKTKKQTTYYVG